MWINDEGQARTPQTLPVLQGTEVEWQRKGKEYIHTNSHEN